MTKIVVFDTGIGSGNAGDEIIMDSVYRNMGDVFEKGFSLRLATHVNNFSAKQILRQNEKVKFYSNADWKFICGTDLLAQKRIGKINSQWQIYPSNISIYDNCVLVGVGSNKVNQRMDFYAKMLYKKVLSRQFIHSTRDEGTKRIVESLGFRAINTGCPTLWGFTSEVCERIPRKKAENCITSVSGNKTQLDRNADQEMLNIIVKSYKKVYVWIQTIEDEVYFNTFHGINGIDKIYSLSQYRAVLQRGNVDYVGTRLHGGILALQNMCRSIIIGIDHRAFGFQETTNLPVLARTEISNKLEAMICSDFDTMINVDQEAISEFKKQFGGA